MATCTNCPDKKARECGLCGACAARARRAGTLPPPAKRKSPADLLLESRAERTDDECWPWAGNISPTSGYGRIRIKGVLKHAHTWSYETHVGPLPEGAEPDHACHTRDEDCTGGKTCRHRPCVNWHHLEPVTSHENWRRGQSPPARNARKTHCGSCGREYDTVVHTARDGDVRRCTRCTNASNRRSAARTRAHA